MKRWQHSLVAGLFGAGLAVLTGGCGGDDPTVSTAYLVDSNVTGVNYRCGSQSGSTGTDGSFRFEQGQVCTFSIGATQFSVAADRLAANKNVTPFDVFTDDDEKVINLARLLQTLDSDGNVTNGIEINASVHAAVTSQIDFGSNFDTNVTNLMTQLGLTLINPVTALQNLAPNVPAPSAYTTFERIAEIDAAAIEQASGFTSPTDQARYVAQAIAKYFYQTNDYSTKDSISDWVLGGAPSSLTALDVDTDIMLLNPYILEIPSPDNNKTMIVEVCNKLHAGAAINGSNNQGGESHGPALPCEIAIYTDSATGKIYVDILDPVGSFAIFFNDMEATAEMAAMALQVKTEIKLITYKGLVAGNIDHVRKATALGATFTPSEIAALSGQYVSYTYDINTSDAVWTAATSPTQKRAVAQKAAQALIQAMTINVPYGYNSTTYASLLGGDIYGNLTFPPYVTATSTGINGNADVNSSLVGTYAISSNGYWRSARYAPLNVPRDADTTTYGFMYTVEACSPTYAKLALSMGGDSRDHATALPCQMTFYIDDTDANNPKLKVIILNPEFMFQTLFKDKFSALSTDEQTALVSMVNTVRTDLVNITRFVMDNKLSWVIPNPGITAD